MSVTASDGRSPVALRAAQYTPSEATVAQPGQVSAKRKPLVGHVQFFDRNNTGYITPLDTYKGWRAMGANVLLSAAGSAIINGALAWPTSESWLPTVTIRLNNIDRALHGSHTGVYDETGAFDAGRFEQVFERYDEDKDGAWNFKEFFHRFRAQRHLFDLFGQTATILEFLALYLMVGQNGRISKEHMLQQYDGTLFYHLEAEHTRKLEATQKAKDRSQAIKTKKTS